MSQTALAERQDTAPALPANESAAILSVIERMAINPDIDPSGSSALSPSKERIDASAAKLKFSGAVADAKARIAEEPIIKNRKGHNDKRYADFSAYAKVVDPVLASLGLTYRFRTTQGDKISVTCILTGHGHEEENTLAGPADASGSKNAIQAIGSTLTYLQRYTLIQALGLAASDDDDGAATGKPDGDLVNMEQIEHLQALIEKAGTTTEAFCKVGKIGALAELRAADLERATKWLTDRIAARDKPDA